VVTGQHESSDVREQKPASLMWSAKMLHTQMKMAKRNNVLKISHQAGVWLLGVFDFNLFKMGNICIFI